MPMSVGLRIAEQLPGCPWATILATQCLSPNKHLHVSVPNFNVLMY